MPAELVTHGAGGQPVTAGIRPEGLRPAVSADTSSPVGPITLPGWRVARAEFVPPRWLVTVEQGGLEWRLWLPEAVAAGPLGAVLAGLLDKDPGDRLDAAGARALLQQVVDGGPDATTELAPVVPAAADRGLLVNTQEDLYSWVSGADKAGLHVMVHAIGDRANALLLDVYERVSRENGPRDRRFRIEHAQHLRRQDISRFKGAGVIASMQPYHAIDDGRWAEKRIGKERAKTTYAFRSLLDSGAILAFGTDWTVAPLDPMLTIYAAVTRRTLDGKNSRGWVPEQKISVEETIRAYTVGSAYAEFQENVKGTLAPGKLADLVILSRDIFKIDPKEIENVNVVLTMVDGKVVYEERE